MATYVRGVGGHVAERERPEPGSDRAGELERLVADPGSDWRVEDEPKPRRRPAEKKAPEPAPEKDPAPAPEGPAQGPEGGDKKKE
ncbi:hypothetical protein [Actinomadura hibisca]|uniref:hypothetical protein n=1 Tax=Actinomadura hibisca TaxID=68565 RepID=UPI0012FBBC6F|nr:hypothetical protein [Actinomadura hibisca]